MHIWTGSQESKLSKIIVERSRSPTNLNTKMAVTLVNCWEYWDETKNYTKGYISGYSSFSFSFGFKDHSRRHLVAILDFFYNYMVASSWLQNHNLHSNSCQIQTSFWRWHHQVGHSLMYACHSWHQILASTQSLSLSLSLFSTNSTRSGWLPKCEYIFYNIQYILAFSSSMIW